MNLTIVSFAKGQTGCEEAEAEFVRRLSGHGSVTVEVVKNWKDKDGLPTRLLGNTYRWGSTSTVGRTPRRRWRNTWGTCCSGETHTWCLPSAAPTACLPGRPGARTLVPVESHVLPRAGPRLLLLEALYRSLDILHGGNYHK